MMAVSWLPLPMCSTPYGIRGLALGLFNLKNDNLIPACSTPYGIRGLARSANAATNCSGSCSTPYGIRGLAHGKIYGIPYNATECSTPYGIRGLARLVPSILDLPPEVLNALRHQRFGTNRLVYDIGWRYIVLNALRHQRFGTNRIGYFTPF